MRIRTIYSAWKCRNYTIYAAKTAEAWNGNPTATNHNDLAMNFVKANALLPTAGSDFHSVGDEGCGVYLENAVHDNAELVAELRKRRHKLFNQNGTIEF